MCLWNEMMADAGTISDELAAVGARIRVLRQKRQMTLQQLSGRVGVSIGMLSQIETGRSSPTIRILQRIADALEVRLICFFSTPEVRERRPPWVFPRDRRRKDALRDKIFKELLTPPVDCDVELSLLTIEQGGSYDFSAYSLNGEDAGVVLEGRLWLEIDGVPVMLESGEAFRIPRSVAGRFENRDVGWTLVLWANTLPNC
jgi:transcriptional regulator with XRE-family HTH domain